MPFMVFAEKCCHQNKEKRFDTCVKCCTCMMMLDEQNAGMPRQVKQKETNLLADIELADCLLTDADSDSDSDYIGVQYNFCFYFIYSLFHFAQLFAGICKERRTNRLPLFVCALQKPLLQHQSVLQADGILRLCLRYTLIFTILAKQRQWQQRCPHSTQQ